MTVLIGNLLFTVTEFLSYTKLQFLPTSLVLTPPWSISLVSVSKEEQPESREMNFN